MKIFKTLEALEFDEFAEQGGQKVLQQGFRKGLMYLLKLVEIWVKYVNTNDLKMIQEEINRINDQISEKQNRVQFRHSMIMSSENKEAHHK